MPDPLSVRINDGTTDRHVTKYVSGLGWTKTAPGGHQGLKFRLNLPRRVFNDLGPADKAWVYDARTGRTVFGAAYLENPTPVDGASGQAYDISAVGGMALANDETRALIYVDKTLDAWNKVTYGASVQSSEAGQYEDGDAGVSGIKVQFNPGTPIGTGAVAAAENRSFGAGQQIAGLRVITVAGKSDAGYHTQLFDFTNVGDMGAAVLSTTGVDQTIWFDINRDAFLLQLIRTGAATNVADDDTWATFYGMSILGRRVDRYGNLLITAAAHGDTAQSVLASQVAEDLLGRLLTMCDPVTSTIDATSFGIDQLAYADGVKAAAVLDDLATLEPDFWWGIHESNDAGLHRFGFQQWATEPRYVVSVADGWRQSGSDIDLCNRVLVSWTDAAGKQQTAPVTAASLGLVGVGLPVDALGSRVKDADPISLTDGHGSEANALQIGGAVLRDKINPPRAGTVTVSRPIVDMVTGNRVMPWELEPGWPVLVREPGYQMRCTEVDYDHDSRSAVLTLGTPVLTESQRIARL